MDCKDNLKDLTVDEMIRAGSIIHIASITTGIMGVAPIGPADTIMITPAQIAMILKLGAFYDIPVSESLAKSLISGFALSIFGRATAGALLSLFPIGWIIKGGTAFTLTEAIGWSAVGHFREIKRKRNKFTGDKKEYAEATV